MSNGSFPVRAHYSSTAPSGRNQVLLVLVPDPQHGVGSYMMGLNVSDPVWNCCGICSEICPTHMSQIGQASISQSRQNQVSDHRRSRVNKAVL